MPCGFYIATGAWLDREHLFKVGHTGDLGARLRDGAYTTCFPPGHWRYAAAFELPSKAAAAQLEAAVLHCAGSRRLGPRELVRATVAEIVAIAEGAAAELGLTAVRRDWPEYPPRDDTGGAAAAAGTAAGTDAGTAAPLLDEGMLARLASLRLGPEPAAADSPAAADAAAAEILSWDWSVLAPVAATPIAVAAAPVAVAAPVVVAAVAAPEPMAADEDEPADDLEGSPFDLNAAPIEVRDYQLRAAELCRAELGAAGRAILQMACRCGKTAVAFEIMRGYSGAAVLFLVPGLALARQTAQKLASYGGATWPTLLVGSDPCPVPRGHGCPDLVMTTDPAEVRAFLAGGGARVVISTYQSSPRVPTDAFGLTIFDECHRVCGGDAPRPFNHFILAPRVGDRLFMTATPAYDPAAITMKDRDLFGGVAYRYHLRRGIAAGYVNDFRLELVAAPPAGGGAAGTEGTLPAQILAAMGQIDKLLVFCRGIRAAERLRAEVRAAAAAAAAAAAPPPFECLVAHSRMGAAAVAAAAARFAAPGERRVLFNCRLFQEGVEIPALNGVFFAAPRHSPRDIIQSVCRPLNRGEGKPPSVVFLPVTYDTACPPADPANLKRFASIVPFVDALLDEDPRLYEHLLDPVGTPYPVGILGAGTLAPRFAGAATLAAFRRAVRTGTSTAARPVERLLRAERVPWDRAFAEVRRVVETCGRYPKTTDAWVVGEARVCLHRFYRGAADEYAAWRGGRPSRLEPHQRADLESLPGWVPFGVEGPYPWRYCLDFLAAWIREHGEPPAVEINRGGYVGLEATDMERLSGCLTCINQGDGRARPGKAPDSGFTISAEKRADLDALGAEFGLRWRKERDAAGALVRGGPPTFIQEAYARFKVAYKTNGAQDPYIARWFPGYPRKHARQENLEVQESGVAPPRWRTGRRRRAAGAAAAAGSDSE